MLLRVVDKARLARVCRQVERWEGSWRAAAKQLDIGAGTFWRLRAAQGGQTINGTVFGAFYRYLPPDDVSGRAISRWEGDLFKAVLTPQATQRFDEYWRWLRREVRRCAKHWNRDDWPREVRDRKDRYSACVRILATLRRTYSGEFAPLDRLMVDENRHSRRRVPLQRAEQKT